MEKELKRQIQKYLNGDPDYTQGLSLLVQASKNKILINNLNHRNSERNLKKIQWELRKEIGDNPFLEKPSKKQKKKKTGSPSHSKSQKAKKKTESYPEIIQDIISKTGDLSSKRDKLHRKLKDVPHTNTASNNSMRKELLDQIREISDHLEQLYGLKDRYFREKIIPSQGELKFPKEKISPKPAASGKDPLKGMSDAELVKKKNNVRSNLTKKKNKLNYQSTTRKKEKNPMPEGPQRDHLLYLIQKDEKLIKQIERRLDGTDKTK